MIGCTNDGSGARSINMGNRQGEPAGFCHVWAVEMAMWWIFVEILVV